MKKAYIVTLEISTRVIADFEEDAAEQAIDKILDNASEYVFLDNVSEVETDKEMPYPQSWEK